MGTCILFAFCKFKLLTSQFSAATDYGLLITVRIDGTGIKNVD